ncbi:MAG: aldo/keto reductase [Patescibacteria group bacterium]
MIIPTKKLLSGFSMPEYGFGTWQMGGRKERDFQNDDKADINAIKTAIDLGITHIDTAELYADGYTETLVAQAIKGYERSKLFIVSKVGFSCLSYSGILEACKNSLKRLQTDYLDLYLLHRYNPEIPLKESIQALSELKDAGLVKEIGVCNFGPEHLKEAQTYTKHKIVCDQVHYNLQFREPEKSGLLDYCQKNDVMLIAWRPTGKGDLLQEIPEVLKTICDKYKKTPAQIAINWLISQQNVVTLSKTRNKEHFLENLGALGWNMKKEDIEKLRKEYPNQKDISDVVPLG